MKSNGIILLGKIRYWGFCKKGLTRSVVLFRFTKVARIFGFLGSGSKSGLK